MEFLVWLEHTGIANAIRTTPWMYPTFETLHYVALLPAGVGKRAVIEALGRLKGAALLSGTRGSLPVDVAAVAEVAHIVGGLLERSPDIAELEINPLVAYPQGRGALALDALIVKSPRFETSERDRTL